MEIRPVTTNPKTILQKEEIERKANNFALADQLVSKLVEQGMPCSRLDFED